MTKTQIDSIVSQWGTGSFQVQKDGKNIWFDSFQQGYRTTELSLQQTKCSGFYYNPECLIPVIENTTLLNIF